MVQVASTTQISGTTVNDFTIRITYKVTAEDNSTQNYFVNINGSAIGWIGGGSNDWKIEDGTYSTGGYQGFGFPNGIFIADSGDIYIADYIYSRISKWDSSGNAIGWIGGGSNGWQTGSAPSSGTDYQSFEWPYDVSIDNSGNIYIADCANNRISKWDSSGNAIGWIGGGSNGWQTGSAPGTGTDYQSFNEPKGVIVDNSGNIYVVDCGNNRISKWDSSGNAIGWIGGGSNGWQTGSAPGTGSDYQSFDNPIGIFIDNSGNIYVADQYNHRISKWDSSGNAIGWIGGGYDGWQTGSSCTSSNSYKHFQQPTGVAIDIYGNIYITDRWNDRICKWDSSGNAIGCLGGGFSGWHTYAVFSGDSYKYFDSPYDIFVDSSGNIYITDCMNHRVCKWK